MGMDASADIWFGFPLKELPWRDYDRDDEDDNEDDDAEERLYRLLGLTDEDFPDYNTTDDAGRKLYSDLREKQREAVDAQTCSLSVDYAGGEEPVYYVECKRAGVHAWWDAPTKFDPTSFGDEDAMCEEIREFCNFMGIPLQEPGWYLSANYA